jgi:predicted RNase H-like nuclease (RuvC/YqgF family)
MHTLCDPGDWADKEGQLFESLMQEKHDLEESLSRMLEERQFVERCLADARMEISRLEMESESTNSSVHQSQLAAAKTEGKLQAAQTRISSLEKELQKKKDEVMGLNDELKRARTNMIQSESEKVGMYTYACSKKAVSARRFVFLESKGDRLCGYICIAGARAEHPAQ